MKKKHLKVYHLVKTIKLPTKSKRQSYVHPYSDTIETGSADKTSTATELLNIIDELV